MTESKASDHAKSRLITLFPSITIGELISGTSGGRLVFKAKYKDRDVITKLHPVGSKKAQQEFDATKQAKSLLDAAGLTVPEIIDIKEEGLLIEFIERKIIFRLYGTQ